MDICVTAFAPSGDKLAATGAHGKFVFSGVRPGKYYLEYRSCGGAERYLTAWYGGSNALSSSQPVLVTGTEVQTLATVTLRPARKPSGRSFSPQFSAAPGLTDSTKSVAEALLAAARQRRRIPCADT